MELNNELPWKSYSKVAYTQMRPYMPGEDLSNTSVSKEDNPKLGDMIARNVSNHNDKWLVAKEYFDASYESVPDHPLEALGSLSERMKQAGVSDLYSYVAYLHGENEAMREKIREWSSIEIEGKKLAIDVE